MELVCPVLGYMPLSHFNVLFGVFFGVRKLLLSQNQINDFYWFIPASCYSSYSQFILHMLLLPETR